ncbi:MAG: hypothetical protein JXM70_09735 [Pirellulales bacterium]|nr:hypothetical protein [Pirellulales bacterium]
MLERYVTLLCNITVRVWILTCLIAVAGKLNAAQFEPGVQVGAVESLLVNEASGIAASGSNSDVLWVHNDSGDSARVFAMNIQGTHLGIYNLTGAGATDWEDMAVGPGPVPDQSYLYLGDIGDNNAVRTSIQVYRVAEPVVSSTQSPVTENLDGVEKIELQYPDGARDAETLMIDPLTNDIYIVSKRESQSRLYRAAYPQSTVSTNIMEYITQLPCSWTTGGDISPDGDEIILRWRILALRRDEALFWSRPSGGDLWDAFDQPGQSVPLVLTEPQGEAICFDPSGYGYYTTSENKDQGPHQPIYYFERIWTPGDANRDDCVDVVDLGILAAHYGTTSGAEWEDADFNGDGKVDASDLGLLATYYGSVSSGASSQAVPEPNMIIMLAVGSCVICLARRRS